MGAGQWFARIPWKQIVGYAPEIAGAAQAIYDSVRRMLGRKPGTGSVRAGKPDPALAGLDRRIERLEANEMRQAELVRDMARQLGELSGAMRVLSRRLLLVAFLAVVALIGLLAVVLAR